MPTTDAATSARLAKIRQRDTKPEIQVRKALFDLGHRFRVSNRDLPGSPDVANRTREWAVFVHGCFWHAHPGCPKATVPKRNREFWKKKFSDNRVRDERVANELRAAGFEVVIVWECETRDPQALVQRLRKELPRERARSRQ